MAFRKIRQMGDDILRKKAKTVTAFDASLHSLLEDMWDTMRHFDGLGMAAPQIGKLRRIVIIEMDDEIYEVINPVILDSQGNGVKTEACLSVPNKQGEVVRPDYLRLEAVDRYGEPYILETEDDMLATALCHEIDHLDGVLFIDKASKIQDRPPDEEVKNIKNEAKAKKKERKGQRKKTKVIRGGKIAAGG